MVLPLPVVSKLLVLSRPSKRSQGCKENNERKKCSERMVNVPTL